MAAANTLLESEFCGTRKRKFAHPPASEEDWHRPVPAEIALEDVFAFEATRSVGNGWTVRYRGRWFQITGPRGSLPPAKQRVVVRRHLDGTVHILYCGHEVHVREIDGRPRGPERAHTAPVLGRRPTPRPARPPMATQLQGRHGATAPASRGDVRRTGARVKHGGPLDWGQCCACGKAAGFPTAAWKALRPSHTAHSPDDNHWGSFLSSYQGDITKER